jgi:hypothetical protein
MMKAFYYILGFEPYSEQICKSRNSLYYSGSNKTGQAVNDFIVMTKAFYYILGFEPYSEQICKSRIKGKYNTH